MGQFLKDATSAYSIGNVTFESDARTNGHTHPAGKKLVIVEGNGWYQERNPFTPLKGRLC